MWRCGIGKGCQVVPVGVRERIRWIVLEFEPGAA